VFAIALDADGRRGRVPNIYLGATSAFGLQIVVANAGDGHLERVRRGDPRAEFMPGQFGTAIGGGPGSIYKVDGVTGGVSLFANIPDNRGPGIGDIVYDPATRQFFASALDSGLIHRISSSGALLDSFDHGVTGRPAAGLAVMADDGVRMDIKSPAFNAEDTATWALPAPERRVWGLAVHAGRLYYAVWAGPQIWSVGLKADGTFADDPRKEIDVAALPEPFPISGMTFDGDGQLYLAQRGGIRSSYDYTVFAEAGKANVLRYKLADSGAWMPVPDEYAIGLVPDHRNASGGVDIGEGVTSSGAPSGRCDTLWSTGGPLSGTEVQKLPLIVHGLQGNATAAVRPANVPPEQAYFIDYDGFFSESTAEGHVGSIKIWRSCQTLSGAGVAPPGGLPFLSGPSFSDKPPFLGVPDGPQFPGGLQQSPDLKIEKIRQPGTCVSITGGTVHCVYTIRVTNEGSVPFTGPIAIDEAFTGPPLLPTVFAFKEWMCAGSLPKFHCEHVPSPTTLNPGGNVELTIALEPKADPAIGVSFQNCASISWPQGQGNANPSNDKACVATTLPGQSTPPPPPPPGPPPPKPPQSSLKLQPSLKIEKIIAPGSECPFVLGSSDKLTGCVFTIRITNTGSTIYGGEVAFEDLLSVLGGNQLDSLNNVGSTPQWDCAGPASKFTCLSPMVLNPGQSIEHSYTVMVPFDFSKGPSTLRNCARITVVAGVAGEACVDFTVVPISNLKLEKFAGGCRKESVNVSCAFRLAVTNTGPGSYLGSVVINEAVPSFASLDSPLCTPNGTNSSFYTCDLAPGGANLAPGQTINQVVWVTMDVNRLDSSTCAIGNIASIKSPVGGTARNSDPTDDFASATAVVGKIDLGNGKFACDPPHLKVTKVANPQVCAKVAGGYECNYKVTVTSTGPDPFHGEIELDETIPSGASLKIPSGAWTCASKASSIHCVHAGINGGLAVGSSVVLDATVVVSDASVRPGACQITNTVHLALSDGPLQGQNYAASAAADIRSDACLSPAVNNKCPPGYALSSTGCVRIAACPVGTAGTPPDCRQLLCPEGTQGRWPNCQPIMGEAPGGRGSGTSGAPSGSKVGAGTASAVGGQGATPTCPLGTTGTPPDCRSAVTCPPGTQGRWPSCRLIGGGATGSGRNGTAGAPSGQKVGAETAGAVGGQGATPTCPLGTTGTQPDCRSAVICPPGTRGRWPRCQPITGGAPANGESGTAGAVGGQRTTPTPGGGGQVSRHPNGQSGGSGTPSGKISSGTGAAFGSPSRGTPTGSQSIQYYGTTRKLAPELPH
jgi:hypothetical protein